VIFSGRTIEWFFQVADGDRPDIGIANVQRRYDPRFAGAGDADSSHGKYGQRNQNKTFHL
jgi:hypothetical protein